MKRKYDSPGIRTIVIKNNLLTINSVKSLNSNVNLKFGDGGSVEARSRESWFSTSDENEYDE